AILSPATAPVAARLRARAARTVFMVMFLSLLAERRGPVDGREVGARRTRRNPRNPHLSATGT
ncbi:MAG: hypothetical protein AAGE83_08650, partial [Pseudomonadota bacterium]